MFSPNTFLLGSVIEGFLKGQSVLGNKSSGRDFLGWQALLQSNVSRGRGVSSWKGGVLLRVTEFISATVPPPSLL